MEYVVIVFAAFFISAFTLFSGFGLGIMLMPVLAIFFSVEIAITLTAIVHFLSNLFKLILLGKYANIKVVLKFGIPAFVAAILGSLLLVQLSELPVLYNYHLFAANFQITLIKLIIGMLLIIFAAMEAIPKLKNLSFDKKYLSIGGVLSGFFGGLVGHQGAFRSAFLIRAGLNTESFIATGVVIACLVDVFRLLVYSTHISSATIQHNWGLLLAATLSAFSGAFLANLFIKKVTFKSIRIFVSVMLLLIAIAMITGII